MKRRNRRLVLICIGVYILTIGVYVVNCMYGYIVNNIYTMLIGGVIFSIAILTISIVISSHYKNLLFHDFLTEIGNRKKLFENMGKLLAKKEAFSVVYLDLNEFKKINDTHGHHIGDDVLILFAENVKEIENSCLASYRIGGDEFVFIITKDLEVNLNKIMSLKQTKNPITNENISFEIGIAHSDDKMSADELIDLADQNMLSCKEKIKEKPIQIN